MKSLYHIKKIKIMAKDVDLNSKRWLDFVFEGRNKKYGAYELRESSSRRHIWAIVIVVMLGITAVLALVFLPRWIKPPTPPEMPLTQRGVVEFIENPIIPEKMPARAVEVQAPATVTSVQRTVGFTDPTIVKDTEVRPEDLMLAQDELTNAGAAFGTKTRDGDTDGTHPDDITSTQEPKEEEEDIPFYNPEKWPVFDGNLLQWLSSNIHYPVDAIELGIEGRVVLRFVVQKDGKIGNVEVLKKLSPSCDREAVRVVNAMPPWIPGSQGKHAVAVYFTLPIQFKMQK